MTARVARRHLICIAAICWASLLFGMGAAAVARARTNPSRNGTYRADSERITIPPGTILPVILRDTVAASKAKVGQIIRGAIAQDVPLPGESKIPKGSKVQGEIVQVTSDGEATTVSLRFTEVQAHGQSIRITTNLRAMAGFMTVEEATLPSGLGTGEGEVAEWLDTTQIGGDTVYGVGGLVQNSNGEVTGKSAISGGVLGQVQANGPCRGPFQSNDDPKALWVFSSNACGTYGLSNVRIAHAGRTDPLGIITLNLLTRKAKIQDGAGLLLRVIG